MKAWFCPVKGLLIRLQVIVNSFDVAHGGYLNERLRSQKETECDAADFFEALELQKRS